MAGKRIKISLPIVADGKAIEIPEVVVEQIVRGAIVAELTRRPEAIEAIVKAVLMAKPDNYARKTIFEELFEKKVQGCAKQAIEEWATANADKIKVAICKRLDQDKGGMVDALATRLLDSLKTDFYVSVGLKSHD